MRIKPLIIAATLCSPALATAQVEVEMHRLSADGVGESIGTVTITEGKNGTLFLPELRGLEPGAHGFHVHENPSCEIGTDGTAGGAAGGHYDPDGTGKHAGPYAEGHAGDLPVLYVQADGDAVDPVTAPRIEPGDTADRALVIHAGGDNYSDQPEELGGGGERIACGVIPAGEEGQEGA